MRVSLGQVQLFNIAQWSWRVSRGMFLVYKGELLGTFLALKKFNVKPTILYRPAPSTVVPELNCTKQCYKLLPFQNNTVWHPLLFYMVNIFSAIIRIMLAFLSHFFPPPAASFASLAVPVRTSCSVHLQYLSPPPSPPPPHYVILLLIKCKDFFVS